MLTFQQIYEEVQAQVQDSNATSLVLIKRAVNQGMKKFANILNREWRNTKRTFSLVASQQLYQLPEDCIRVKSVKVLIGGVTYPLTEIVDEDLWNEMNMTPTTSGVPEAYFIDGNDVIGIYPTPSASVADAVTLRYERSVRDMAQADYTTGTVEVTNGSVAVVGTDTVFTEKMVGRTLFITDGTADGMGYKIASYTDSTHISLENKYAGSSGSVKTYLIGEVPDIPEEYHESLIDYGCFRYYLRRKDRGLAKDFAGLFSQALEGCQANYSSKTTSQYFRKQKLTAGYRHMKRDLTVT